MDYSKRAWNKATSIFRTFKEPAFDKLLPDQILDPSHPRPYTLIVDLDKFLVCHMWDPEHSRWRIAKRPGSELFLFYAAQMFEVVVFSSLPQHEGDALVKKLDPFGCISHSLFRFATTHTNSGVYLKDLSKLNRDLSKVIVLGHDKTGFSGQPDNFIQMREWNGDAKDRALEESIDYLEMLAFSRMKDLRPAVKYQKGREFPDDFEKEQENSFELARQKNLEMIEKRNNNFFFRLIGLSKSASALQKDLPATYRTKKEERMELRRKEFAHLRDLMRKQMEAEMDKEKAFYKDHKMTLWDLFSKGPPAPKPE